MGLGLWVVMQPVLAWAEAPPQGILWCTGCGQDRQEIGAIAGGAGTCLRFSMAGGGFPDLYPVPSARMRLFALSKAKHILPFTPILATE